jgi:hypothetical protein
MFAAPTILGGVDSMALSHNPDRLFGPPDLGRQLLIGHRPEQRQLRVGPGPAADPSRKWARGPG